jgi:hypothetical protein
MDNSTANNMNDILSKLKEKLACDDECQKERKTEELKKKWTDAEKIAKHSNEEIELAKKNYYLFTGGQTAYNNKKRTEYIQSTADYAQNENAQNSENANAIARLLARYDFNTEHIRSLNELFAIKQQENKVLENKIDDYEKKTFTSQRKVIYEKHDMTRIMTYNKILVFLYYGLFIFYLATGNFFTDKLYKERKLVVILLIYVLFPFILHFVVKKLFDVKDTISYLFNNKIYKNVYTNV